MNIIVNVINQINMSFYSGLKIYLYLKNRICEYWRMALLCEIRAYVRLNPSVYGRIPPMEVLDDKSITTAKAKSSAYAHTVTISLWYSLRLYVESWIPN